LWLVGRRSTELIILNIPLAATGGILALLVRGMPFSISAAVGFIALFGVAVLNGIVLLSIFVISATRVTVLNRLSSKELILACCQSS
jgi:Cu/Ag efflux pump CusA